LGQKGSGWDRPNQFFARRLSVVNGRHLHGEKRMDAHTLGDGGSPTKEIAQRVELKPQCYESRAAAEVRRPTIDRSLIAVVNRLARRRPMKFSKVSNIDQPAALPSRHTRVITAPTHR
jgi:hypothetical protein